MDRKHFIRPEFVSGTTVEGKILALLNGFDEPEDFEVIQDRLGYGYARDREGYGIGRRVAERFIALRPPEGFTSLDQIAFINEEGDFDSPVSGFGPDKFSDLILSAIALSPGVDHRSIRGSFRVVNPDGGIQDMTATLTEPIDVIAYGRFSGSPVDAVVPVQLVETDAAGQFVIEHITNDYQEFALVACFKDSGEVFHRSGLINIQSYPFDLLDYNPIMLNQVESKSDSDFRDQVEEQEGNVLESGETIKSLTSDFKDGFIEMEGEIVAPDTFLFFDSNITFTSHVTMAGSQYSENWVRDMDSLVAVNSTIVEQNHSNVGFIIVSILAFLIPYIGIALGTIVSIVFASIDAAQDASLDTKKKIAEALRTKLGDEMLDTFAELIRLQVDEATLVEQIGLRLLSEFEDNGEEDLDAIAEFMVNHKTVQQVAVDPDDITFNVWLTLPFYIS